MPRGEASTVCPADRTPAVTVTGVAPVADAVAWPLSYWGNSSVSRESARGSDDETSDPWRRGKRRRGDVGGDVLVQLEFHRTPHY